MCAFFTDLLVKHCLTIYQADNRFVLVLIDGDNYIVGSPVQSSVTHSGTNKAQFDHRYVTEKEQGGRMVAKILKKTVKQLLVSHTPEDMDTNNIRIMVRVYADVLALSKKLAKLKITGREARSLAPFIAGFNQAEPMFEFVDTGDEEICTANKIMGESAGHLLRLFKTYVAVRDPRTLCR